MAKKAKTGKTTLDPGSGPGRRGSRRLKVFRTPIGFHDAYVAAPSQKAALAAWGADSNLFAQGLAEQVTEPALMEEALARPGEVVRRIRGSAGEHVAAIEASGSGSKGKKDGSRIKSGLTKKGKTARPPRPSRDELDAAEAAVEEAEARHRSEMRAIDGELAALERRRRELLRKHERERDRLGEERDRAASAYKRAMRAWKRASR